MILVGQRWSIIDHSISLHRAYLRQRALREKATHAIILLLVHHLLLLLLEFLLGLELLLVVAELLAELFRVLAQLGLAHQLGRDIIAIVHSSAPGVLLVIPPPRKLLLEPPVSLLLALVHSQKGCLVLLFHHSLADISFFDGDSDRRLRQ